MTGTLTIAGLGPGSDALVTPEVSAALASATDILGYAPYVSRVQPRPGLTLHPSDNREELARASEALRLAAEGGQVVVVSSGDPGVFAMASAVFEALEQAPQYRELPIRVLPGITAMLAASARAGAPLGHDFCAINLSDNLKPWALIEKRLRLAAEADFAIALYNPRSVRRSGNLAEAANLLLRHRPPETPCIIARNLGRAGETIEILPLASLAGSASADMLSIVLVGSSRTRLVPGEKPRVYTPRGYFDEPPL